MPMGLSATELLIIATILIVAITAGAITLNRRRGDTTARRPAMPAPSPRELDAALHDLIRQDKKIQAIKLLREHTRMGLREAKDAVDGLAAGHPVPYPPAIAQRHTPPQADADLATRVRRLKEAGRTEQAVFLVRGETGMDEASATLFVDSL